MKRVAIIGGGFAGLAAAVALAERGVGVDVLEERPHLGGRAYSFRDEATGETVDNGQHALMGCYHHTLTFLERIGASAKITRQRNLRVDMIHPQRGTGAIACPPLPSPLHVGAGLLGYTLLSKAERLRALYAGLRLLALRRRADESLHSETVAGLLRQLGQSENACASFWNPVTVATLNESPERAAAAAFAEVMARAFFASRKDSQFVLPSVGLSELYTGDAARFIREHGGTVTPRERVLGLEVNDGRGVALRLADGRTVHADACISAVPPRILDRILGDGLRRRLGLPELDSFDTAPIVSAHLWFDRPVLNADFVGLIGTATQWLFRKETIAPRDERPALFRISAVISAGREMAEWDNERIRARIADDVAALIPAARSAELVRAVVVKEKNATVSPTPQAERRRPPLQTRAASFVLAGDWVATGLPPTIESAVLSGHNAAAAVLQSLVLAPPRAAVALPAPARAVPAAVAIQSRVY